MMETVWARDPTEGFILGLMSELTEDGAEIIPINVKYTKRICSFNDIFQVGDPNKEFDDNCMKNNICIKKKKFKLIC